MKEPKTKKLLKTESQTNLSVLHAIDINSSCKCALRDLMSEGM